MAEYEGRFYFKRVVRFGWWAAGNRSRRWIRDGTATAWESRYERDAGSALAVDPAERLFAGGVHERRRPAPAATARPSTPQTGALTSRNPAATEIVVFQPGGVRRRRRVHRSGVSRAKRAVRGRPGPATPNAGMSTSFRRSRWTCSTNNGLVSWRRHVQLGRQRRGIRLNLPCSRRRRPRRFAWAPEPVDGALPLLRDRGTPKAGGFFTNIAGWSHPHHAAPSTCPTSSSCSIPEPGGDGVHAGAPRPTAFATAAGLLTLLRRRGRSARALRRRRPSRRDAAGANGRGRRHERTADLSRQAPGLYWYLGSSTADADLVRPVTVRPVSSPLDSPHLPDRITQAPREADPWWPSIRPLGAAFGAVLAGPRARRAPRRAGRVARLHPERHRLALVKAADPRSPASRACRRPTRLRRARLVWAASAAVYIAGNGDALSGPRPPPTPRRARSARTLALPAAAT